MRKIITFGIFLSTQLIYSQMDPSSQNETGISNTASPNAAGFMRFQESPVNYYNGRSSFSIPIYEINVGGIKYPISLNYSHGGIQVNSIASDVGLGWSLTSCFINRTVVGDADLETINYGNNTGQYKYGYFDYQEHNYVPNPYGEYHNLDFYPDLFKFVSPSGNRKFYFIDKQTPVELDGKATRISWTIEKNKYEYLKDTDNQWINNQIEISDYKDFTLLTNDGIQYFFENKDITHSFVKSAENEESLFGNIKGTYPRVSSWNVSKIKNLNTNEEIDFTYETYSETKNITDEIINEHPYYRYESKYPWAVVDGDENNIYFRVDQHSTETDYGRYYNRLLKVQRIKKIEFRGGSVEFDYGIVRLDLTIGEALKSIVVKDVHGNIIKEFNLDYGYFESTLIKNEFSKRLKLLSVQQNGYNKYEFQYYEEGKLPNIGSPLQDFFGYNNAEETTVETPELITSKYYYYPNRNEYSILPYDIPNQNRHLINAPQYTYEQLNKVPNDLSKIWSLKSVTLPTGGINTYVLESNTFNLWGNNLNGGGTRITQQVIEESAGGQQRTINYHYNDDTNTSTGYLFNVPRAGYPTSVIAPDLSNLTNPLLHYFLLYGNAKVNYDLLNNFFIGYSKVEENEDGIKTVYEFTNEEKPNVLTRSYTQEHYLTYFPVHPFSEFLISNSAYGNDFYIDNSYRRGKLKKVSYYNKSGKLQMEKENVYQGYIQQSGEDMDAGIYIPGTSIYSNPLNLGEYWELMQFKKTYYTTVNHLVYTKTTKHFLSGNIEDESNFYYDFRNQNLETVVHKTGDGLNDPIIDMKRYLYPNMFSDPAMNYLANTINKDNTPIYIINASGEIDLQDFWTIEPPQTTSKSQIKFSKDANTSDLAMPTQILTATVPNDFYEVAKLDRYDDMGNVLQSTKDGVSTTYIYGYNQLYPIAKIEGATYQQVMSSIGLPDSNTSYTSSDIYLTSNLDKNETTENNLITALDTFRKTPLLSDYRITTYTYDPLVGVTSVTTPSGMREIYIYDEITKKLKEVKRQEKDENGSFIYRTIQENEYHYKP